MLEFGASSYSGLAFVTDLPPILLAPWLARVVWLSPELKCPGCGWIYRAAQGHGDLWLTCQNKKCNRTRWRAVTIYPGMIGATLIALFGADRASEVLHRIYPETKSLSEEDQWGWQLARGSEIEYLQWQVSKLEAHRDSQDPKLGRGILRVLGAL